MNTTALLATAAAQLAVAGIAQPRREARLLLAHAAGLPPSALLSDPAVDAASFTALVARRAAREPLALITGRQGFWSIDLVVSPATLIPRADTETLIEAALDAFADRDARHVLDLGTGTGCLLLAALSEFAGATGVGVDVSPHAAALARRNAVALGLADRAAFVCGHWADALAGRFDLVLSNPPYIETAVIAGLMPEVAEHEPASALDGGVDGLDAYRAIIPALPGLLAPGGVAILELGAGQAGAVAGLAEAAGLAAGPPRMDLGGIARALPLRLSRKKSFGGAADGG